MTSLNLYIRWRKSTCRGS